MLYTDTILTRKVELWIFFTRFRLKLPKNLVVPDEKKMGKKRGRIQSVNELEVPGSKSGLLNKKTLTKSVSELR